MNDNINKVAPAAHLMLDLETLGTKPGCVILEFSAAVFWPDAPESHPLDVRKWQISVASCVAAGLTIDPATVQWWLAQKRGVQIAVLCQPEAGERLALAEALAELAAFAVQHRVSFVWGKGPTFDLSILKSAFEAAKVAGFWNFWQERCVRTVYGLAPEGFDWAEPHVAHDSREDVAVQVINVCQIWRGIRRGQEKVVAAAPASSPIPHLSSLISHPSSPASQAPRHV